MQTEAGVTRCPQCAQQIRLDPGYVTWCDQCDWNVDPTGSDHQQPAWRVKLEHQLADTLYRELENGRIQRPGVDAARIAAYLLSAVLLVLPLVALVGGVALLVFYRPLWLSIPLAAIAIAIGLMLRPRATRLDPDVQLVFREDAPVLFGLLDQIAAAVGTTQVAAVALDAEPNVCFVRVGWRFRPVIGIGLPLWTGLRPQERVAVLAHELGHGRNGDARHGWVVDAAESVLEQLEAAFTEQPYDEYKLDAAHALGTDTSTSHLTRVINSIVGPIIRGYAWLLDRVSLRGNQRAEYLADRTAAEVAGSEAAAWALERTLLGDTSYRALERALRFEKDLPPLEAVRRAVAETPKREIERRLRVSRLRETRTDSSHPPTYLRAKLIRARPATSARVVLGLNENQAIDQELAAAAEQVLKDLRGSL
ncbi:M48 family metalloprotease [Kribbella sp. NPDC051770]|uniref:M48 family metalloprotease n=1 Tax=Kribbella sp. NPDC051770 TaxID=3155413 RepID=UPI00342E0D33